MARVDSSAALPVLDRSNGYDAFASEYMAAREARSIGVDVVRRWAKALPAHAVVLDVGCGHGVPLSSALLDEGCAVFGIDASPRMISAFRERLPRGHAACEPVEQSAFFGRSFDGVLAWGLLFLLSESAQQNLIQDVAGVLAPSGRFLFTSPRRACTWTDVLTGRQSRSLGVDAYSAILRGAGLVIVDECSDEGGNDYYEAARR